MRLHCQHTRSLVAVQFAKKKVPGSQSSFLLQLLHSMSASGVQLLEMYCPFLGHAVAHLVHSHEKNDEEKLKVLAGQWHAVLSGLTSAMQSTQVLLPENGASVPFGQVLQLLAISLEL